jgi:soluble lytic murein transglycosylase-like protein
MKRFILMSTAVAALVLGSTTHAAAAPEPLSAADARLYEQAFDAAEKGDFDTAEARLAKVKDESLKGRLGYIELMHPKTKASWDDLAGWLKVYGAEAGADRIHALALRRRPDDAAKPKAPTYVAALAAAEKAQDAKAKPSRAVDRAQAAREAYYSGDVKRALSLASAAGERWIAGLASFRLSQPREAFAYFSAVANDATQDDWLRSAGAYWAARTAALTGSSDATAYLRLAAATPNTFYGMIAERQLLLASADAAETALGGDPIADLISKAAYTTPVAAPMKPAPSAPALPTDSRAHRAEALFQIGRKTDALAEVKIGQALAKTDKARDAWQELADEFAPPPAPKAVKIVSPPAVPVKIPTIAVRTASTPTLPTPELTPQGGFTIDRAMVYALVRQESAFNPMAQSGAGAVGLMQLMPDAAARAAGDDKLKADMSPLFDPAFNLRVGQDYFTWLMERGLAPDASGGYDVLRTVAAYNGGPGTLLKTAAQLGVDCDSLLLIESLPAQETRNYVERVMAAYWQYRRMFGAPTPTLDALAAGERLADFRLDGGIVASSLPSFTGG